MKYLKIVILFPLIAVICGFTSEDWGRTGHRATGAIAEQHLTKKAKRQIGQLLDGKSLALVSTYADEIRSDDAYREYAPWHYVNFPFDLTYDSHPKSEQGDIYVAINTCIAVLKDKNSSKEKKAFHLKLLVHFVGDLHQPLHVGIAEDRGGNRFQVQWFDEGTNLHRVWDEELIESFQMSYSELAENTKMLSEIELENIKKGSVKDWMNESRRLCVKIYETTESGENLGYRYMYDYMDVVREQLQRGGIRLAVLLNEIFD
ncbi:S1/P1 nuclease [Constantimarinum furrinae]|uniref:S1/P1 Nuclease n=1 Tax=Constantimarinum furrinae TaxID=2562285 RepID=A0A7G8PVB7_9FLAO|nr:S1/P1 nuclease [Constantimarinum furrinae]QNJ98283.1 Putative S1/P1 Nuclease [Constantimarinum furrinae]